MEKHYLYRHIRLDTNTPFYIGIGTKQKRNHNSIKSEYRRAYEIIRKESSIWNNIINKTEYKIEIVLESNDYEFIKEKEKEFILLYGRLNINAGPLANLTNGGDGFINYIFTDEHKKKIGERSKNRIQSKEEKQKRIKSREGYIHSEETKHKISEANKGKKKSKEHLEKLFKGQMLANSKLIIQYTMDNKFIKEWQSATEAAKIFNVHPASIRQCVTGKTKSSVGYSWKPAQISYK